MNHSPPPSRPEPEGRPPNDLGFSLPPPARVSALRLIVLLVIGLLVIAGVFLAGYLPRREQRAELERTAAVAATQVLRVTVVQPKQVADGHTLRLSGNVQAQEEAVIYARASGYVKRWLVDIGAHVKEDELLAELETPELQQELLQARAALAQARANLVQARASNGLSKSSFDRTGKLAQEGIASQQELDQSRAAVDVGDATVQVAEAAIAAQNANIQRLVELQRFAKVNAPFAGTITARWVERGSLVTAGNATQLFRVAATDVMRVFVQVPQSTAPSVRVDLPAKVRIREFADADFQGQVTRTSGALDATSRTLNTEIRVPNPDGKLLVGMYAEVELSLPVPHRVFELPSTALMNDAAGLRVATVQADGSVQFRRITIERDLGPSVQIAGGLEGDERIVQIASPELVEGGKVEVVL